MREKRWKWKKASIKRKKNWKEMKENGKDKKNDSWYMKLKTNARKTEKNVFNVYVLI